MSKSGIYKITNTVNRKIYIGSAINLKDRTTNHLWCLRNKRHCNGHLQKSFNKYGESAFLFEIIEYCKPYECISREQFYIDIFIKQGSDLYNICLTAGSVLGRKMSEETKRKIGLKNSQNKMSDEQKSHLRKLNLGKKRSKEAIKKMILKRTGSTMSNEAKIKISASNKGKPKSESHKEAMRAARAKSTYKRVMSDETKRKLSIAHMGKVLSIEHRKKLSDSHKKQICQAI